MKPVWPRRRLTEVAQLVGGSTPARDTPEYWGGDIPWVTPTELPMPGEGIASIAATAQTITRAGLDSCAAVLVPPGTVLFSSRATIGKLAVAEVPLATNQGFANFIPRSIITPRFLAYVLWFHMEDIAHLAGSTTFKEVSRGRLANFEIPLPPPPEQERIVRILDVAEELRRLRAQADRRTADLIPALFYDMFGDPAINPNGFERLPLDRVCERITDGTHQPPPFAAEGLPFLFVKNIVKGYIDFNTEKSITEDTYIELTRRVRPERGDILYSTVGSYGVAVQVETDQRFAFQRHIGHIKPVRSRIDSAFLSAQLNTPFVRAQADKRARGVAQKTVNLAEIRQFQVLVPPLPLQRQFAARVAEIRALEARQAESRRRLDDLFASLLHRAFQGEL